MTIALIVWVHEGQRRIPVQYGKRVRTMRGNRMMMVGGQSTYVPLRVNTAGMIPLIFAQSLLILPSTLASYFVAQPGWVGGVAQWFATAFSPQNFLYWLLYFLFTVAFTYFYTDVMFRQQNLPETLQKQGGFIRAFARAAHRVLSQRRAEPHYLGRRSVPGLRGRAALHRGRAGRQCLRRRGILTGYQSLIISSTGLLIVVGVVLDTMKQIEAQLLMRNYEGFIR
ncbi:MAG: SecY family transport protein [Caldilineaceae bacterium]